MKHIAFVIGGMTRGGAERVISILANYYANDGWDVDIIMMLNKSIQYELDLRINIVCLTADENNKIKSAPKWVWSFRKYVKNKNPDIIVSFVARINLVVLLATLGMNIPIIVSERNDPAADGRSVLVDIGTKILYRRSKKVIFQTKRVKHYFGNRIQNKSDIIPNPVSVACPKKDESSHKIVAAGRLAKQKNHQLLIAAFSEVHKVYPTYELWIYGEGSLRQELEKQILILNLQRNVHLPGNVSDIHNRISDAEIFVLSSDYEGLSNAMIEAMMMGIPCISTACAGADEYIRDGESGLLVPIGNQEALVSAMKKLIENQELRSTIAIKGKCAVECCEADTVMDKWRDAIES